MVEELLEGHRRFRTQLAASDQEVLAGLARDGQRPTALLIGCSDSRVVPELMTGAAPGQLFVVRNIANRVPAGGEPDTSVSAAVEYAVGALGIHEIVVCGHDLCGGVAAVVDNLAGIPAESDLAAWLAGLRPVVERTRIGASDRSDHLRRAVEGNVLDGMANLMTSATVATAVVAGSLRLHAWVYGLDDATIRVYDRESDTFRSIHPA